MIAVHLLIISDILPSDIAWDGGLNSINNDEFILKESFALIKLVFFSIPVLIKLGIPNKEIYKKKSKFVNIALFAIMIYYILNSLGNFVAERTDESAVFMPLTVILAILFFLFARAKGNS